MDYREDFANILDELSTYRAKRGDVRARVFKRAHENIILLETPVYSAEDLSNVPGVGPGIIKLFQEYVQNGKIQILEDEKARFENVLSDVYGVGPKSADELVKKGIKSIAELRENQDLLNDIQKIGLKYYEDILKRIPRDEINKYNELFTKKMNYIKDSTTKFEIVGSYRRGKTESGDIDVIITSENRDVFKNFISRLIEDNVIIEVLSRGNSKSLVIGRLNCESTPRRIDFLYSPPDEYAFAILYFTGSKIFNTVMRKHALTMEYSLNEHGLYKKLPGQKKEEKIEEIFKDEKDIFDFLGLEFKEPIERINGASVVKKTGSLVVQQTKKEIKPKEPKETKPKETKPKETKPKATKTKRKTSPKSNVTRKKPALTNEVVMEYMKEFKEKGLTFLKSLKEKEIASIVTLANEQFHSYDESKVVSLTDNEYDIIKEYLEKKNPKNKALKDIGAPVEKNKVELPVNMPSMDKIKPDTNALTNWQSKYSGPYVLSCKLDGVSGLYYSMDGKRKLYTRGNGSVGQDVSHLLNDINIPNLKDVIVRGEFIIKKKTFEDKYKSVFSNPRNLVAGIVNRKSKDNKAKDIDFIAYEVIEPKQKPSSQMTFLKTNGFETVKNESKTNITNNYLSDILMDWRTNYEYEIDGIIVSDDKIHKRTSGNPDHSFAFKMVMTDQVTEAKVVDVIWKPSKDGYLKPRVRIEPVNIGGVKIEYATGFNGNFVETNKIGIGAVVQLIRSGDVIPHIKGVTTPADKAKMPDVSYSWTDTHVDIIMTNKDEDPEVLSKNLTMFFTSLGVDGLSIGNIKKLIKGGYNTICKIIEMTESDFLKIEGFKEKMAKKLTENIKASIESASLLKIMAASGKFGRGIGERKIRPIMEAYPDILFRNETNSEKITMLQGVEGIGKENSKSFVESISTFLEFMRQCKLTNKFNEKKSEEPKINVDSSHPLFNKKIVMTKIRDKEINEKLASYGASVVDKVKADVFTVITKSKEETSSKLLKAREMNITIMTPEEFKNMYFV